MIKKMGIVVALILAMPLLSGCGALLVGGAVGYAVSADSVKGQFDSSYEKAYKASLDVAKSMVGSIDMADEAAGWIKSESEDNNVAIHIVKQTDKTMEITVSARKYGTPRVQFARDILYKISKKLK
jgi:hypothetical protein